MREAFPGYCKLNDVLKKEIWGQSTFVFDTNVLLNLYRYSDETRDDFIKSILALDDRLWLPYRCAEEFLKNRTKVISDQQKAYDETIKDIKKLINTINSSRSHPFISKKSSMALSELFIDIQEELRESQEINTNRIIEDEIKEKVFDIFDGKVSGKPSRDYLEEIISEGEGRYKEKIPPGYKDASKASGDACFSDRLRPYGDFLIWKSILEHAKDNKTDIVFVTDDNKEVGGKLLMVRRWGLGLN
ncbi:PIN domain-containing protein [Neptuniibacter sp. QD37_11]|uniref:PIN domain-containing protein n=1 Tax=Neptuniibacter sp. QD37_11 TaxID=3398209 RepID=UPI0039F58B23